MSSYDIFFTLFFLSHQIIFRGSFCYYQALFLAHSSFQLIHQTNSLLGSETTNIVRFDNKFSHFLSAGLRWRINTVSSIAVFISHNQIGIKFDKKCPVFIRFGECWEILNFNWQIFQDEKLEVKNKFYQILLR